MHDTNRQFYLFYSLYISIKDTRSVMQPKCVCFLPTIDTETIDSKGKLSRFLLIVYFNIKSSLLRHQLSRYISIAQCVVNPYLKDYEVITNFHSFLNCTCTCTVGVHWSATSDPQSRTRMDTPWKKKMNVSESNLARDSDGRAC